MNILSQNYNNVLKNMIFDIFTTKLKEVLLKGTVSLWMGVILEL